MAKKKAQNLLELLDVVDVSKLDTIFADYLMTVSNGNDKFQLVQEYIEEHGSITQDELEDLLQPTNDELLDLD
ncbi:MAG: hypothetical protein QM571_03330 [Micrococcaceae bacterium]